MLFFDSASRNHPRFVLRQTIPGLLFPYLSKQATHIRITEALVARELQLVAVGIVFVFLAAIVFGVIR